MGLETQMSLVCDQCHERSDWFDAAIFTRPQMLRELRELGWIRRRGGRLFDPWFECHRCSGERKAAIR